MTDSFSIFELFLPKFATYQSSGIKSPGILVTLQDNVWKEQPIKTYEDVRKVHPKYPESEWSKVGDLNYKFVILAANGQFFTSIVVS
jgi:hypothetical protein